jgi:hypothetical protein
MRGIADSERTKRYEGEAMRVLLITAALMACGGTTDGRSTYEECHEVVTCGSSWDEVFTGAEPDDGCEAPCQDRGGLGSDPSCHVTVDLLGSPVEVACEDGFIEWGDVPGCCVAYQNGNPDEFSGVKFVECE